MAWLFGLNHFFLGWNQKSTDRTDSTENPSPKDEGRFGTLSETQAVWLVSHACWVSLPLQSSHEITPRGWPQHTYRPDWLSLRGDWKLPCSESWPITWRGDILPYADASQLLFFYAAVPLIKRPCFYVNRCRLAMGFRLGTNSTTGRRVTKRTIPRSSAAAGRAAELTCLNDRFKRLKEERPIDRGWTDNCVTRWAALLDLSKVEFSSSKKGQLWASRTTEERRPLAWKGLLSAVCLSLLSLLLAK